MPTGFRLAGAKLEDAVQETEHSAATDCCHIPVLVDLWLKEAVQSKTSQTPGVDS